jgi:hypothetical protein
MEPLEKCKKEIGFRKKRVVDKTSNGEAEIAVIINGVEIFQFIDHPCSD